jgi:CheY-like chemotaxis protein
MSKCILVVEDQEDNRRILRDLLGNAGFRLASLFRDSRQTQAFLKLG